MRKINTSSIGNAIFIWLLLPASLFASDINEIIKYKNSHTEMIDADASSKEKCEVLFQILHDEPRQMVTDAGYTLSIFKLIADLFGAPDISRENEKEYIGGVIINKLNSESYRDRNAADYFRFACVNSYTSKSTRIRHDMSVKGAIHQNPPELIAKNHDEAILKYKKDHRDDYHIFRRSEGEWKVYKIRHSLSVYSPLNKEAYTKIGEILGFELAQEHIRQACLQSIKPFINKTHVNNTLSFVYGPDVINISKQIEQELQNDLRNTLNFFMSRIDKEGGCNSNGGKALALLYIMGFSEKIMEKLSTISVSDIYRFES